MEMKIVGITVTVLVSLVVLAGVLMPVLDDATAKEDTFTNDGFVRMTKYNDTDSVSFVWDHTNPAQVTINDEVVKLPYSTTGASFVLTAGGNAEFLLRYTSFSPTTGQMSWFASWGGAHASTSDATDMTVEFNAGTATVSITGSDPFTATYTDYLFMVSNNGDYTMKKPTELAYLNGDSEVYGIGRTSVGGTGYSFVIVGTIDDGFTASVVQTGGPTLSTPEAAYTESNDHKDLYNFDKITLVATKGGTDYDITYNQVIVPYEVTAERSVHFTDNQKALFAVIPVLIIVAILIGVVALVIRSRLD